MAQSDESILERFIFYKEHAMQSDDIYARLRDIEEVLVILAKQRLGEIAPITLQET